MEKKGGFISQLINTVQTDWTSLFNIQFGSLVLSDVGNGYLNQKARFLWKIVWGVIFANLFLPFGIFFYDMNPLGVLLIAFVNIVINGMVLLLASRKKVLPAKWAFVIANFLFVFWITMSTGGSDSPLVYGLFLVVFTAIVLISAPVGIGLAFLAVVSIFGVEYLAGAYNWIGFQSNLLGFIPDRIIHIIVFSLGVLIFSLVDKNSEVEIKKASLLFQRYQALFESISDAVFVISLDLRIFSVNPEAEKLTGYESFNLMRMGVDEIMTLYDFERLSVVRDQLLQGDDVDTFEAQIIANDGKLKDVEFSVGLVNDEFERPEYIQAIVRDVSSRKQMQRQLQRSLAEMQILARKDELTGLLNRRAMKDVSAVLLDMAINNQAPFSLVMMDMDWLKQINDNYGHPAGDRAILYLAEVLKNEVSERGHIARWGGDEFMVVLPDIDPETARDMARHWCLQLNTQNIQWEDHEIPVTVSMGVSGYAGADGDANLEVLISQADKRLYGAKEAGKNRIFPPVNLKS